MLPGVSAVGRAATIRAVGVRIVPAPKSVVESREILRVLQSFGTITTYRWLKVRLDLTVINDYILEYLIY